MNPGMDIDEENGPDNPAPENHYIDNNQFRQDMELYQSTQSPELLSFISTEYLIPIAEAVANKWTYMFSSHEDLTQTALKAAIAARNHPNALSHPFNFFTRVSRNAMLDLSRSDSGKAQKSKDFIDQHNTGFIQPVQKPVIQDALPDCPVINAILYGDGTTRQGQASIPKIAKETGLPKTVVEKRLKELSESLFHHLRPSQKHLPANPPKTAPAVFTYTQLSLPLGPFPDETYQIQKLRRSNRPAKPGRANHLSRQKHCHGHTRTFTRQLQPGLQARVWN